MGKKEFLKTAKPHLIAEIYLYPTEVGGKTKNILLSWGCPGFPDKDKRIGFDVYPLLGDSQMAPSERREIGVWLMNPDEAIPEFQNVELVYLWEGKIIGEMKILRVC